MPRKSEIEFRNLIGLIPWSRLTKEQRKIVNASDIQPDKVEYYFGRRCEYYKVDKLKSMTYGKDKG